MDKPASDLRDPTKLPPGTVLYLGEIIYWIASDRGKNPGLLHANWDAAERELVDKCAIGEIIASGELAGALVPIDEMIDKSIWRRGTVRGSYLLEISPIDSSIGSEFGGVVSISHENSPLPSKTWSAVGVPVEQVLKSWPSALTVDNSPPDDLRVRMADRIKTAGGLIRLSHGEKQIWATVQNLIAQDSLPVRRQDYIQAIRKNTNGAPPAASSIDRFFRKFGDGDGQQ